MRRDKRHTITAPTGSAICKNSPRKAPLAVLRGFAPDGLFCSAPPVFKACLFALLRLCPHARPLRTLALVCLLFAATGIGEAPPALAAAAVIPVPTPVEPRVHEPVVSVPTVAVPTVQAPVVQAPPLMPSGGQPRKGWATPSPSTQVAENGARQASPTREIMGFLFGGHTDGPSDNATPAPPDAASQPSAPAHSGKPIGSGFNGAPAPSGSVPVPPQTSVTAPAQVAPPAPVAPVAPTPIPAAPGNGAQRRASAEMQPQSPEAQLRQKQQNAENERLRQEKSRRDPRPARTPQNAKPAASHATEKQPDAHASGPSAAAKTESAPPAMPEPAKAESPFPPGSPEAQANEAYLKGDFAQARAIWQHLAESGDGQSMNNLGVLYDLGLGVEPDEGRALHWFAQSAAAGHPSGMSNYGRMLEQGRGIEADPHEAARWFDLAARQGQPEAQYNLGLMYESGHGVPQDHKAAAAWYSRAAAQQQIDALARLGHLYNAGQGVEKDPARATLLLYAAAMRGSVHAMKELEALAAASGVRHGAVLFGQRLDTAHRAAMRDALSRSGMQASRQDDAYICDLYTPGALVPGARQMALCYGPGRPAPLGFVELEYAAPNQDTAQSILRMVSERFGPPSAGEGDSGHIWNLGTVIVATRYDAAQQTVSLMYMIPAIYHLTRQD